MKNGKRILSIEIEHEPDDSPDTSHLGEYANRPTSKYSIDRLHSLDCPVNTGAETDEEQDCGCPDYWDNREYRYFNPSFNYVDKDDKLLPELTTVRSEKDVRNDIRCDYARMEALNRGDWSYIGIRATAEVQVQPNGAIQRITSGGLWGVEDDSSADYIAEVERDELADLKATLRAMGFSARAVATAMKEAKRG